MSFSIESSLPAPTPVYGQRRKGARNGGRSGRNSAWPPRCGEEGSPEYSHDQGLWELRCEWDRLAGLDEVLSYLETQDTALGELEAAVTNGQGTDALAALHRRFREIAARRSMEFASWVEIPKRYCLGASAQRHSMRWRAEDFISWEVLLVMLPSSTPPQRNYS